ncbi:hypothetical protein EB796_007234 [Bugula neritina]|uniref:Uncharacterized protein n=1 Tax=Bugula neritina TaxID=10212 RepID=A0A7J7KA21_BUGNE|nr:hypothetical protein EB796_007234 [Bugula neritina]
MIESRLCSFSSYCQLLFTFAKVILSERIVCATVYTYMMHLTVIYVYITVIYAYLNVIYVILWQYMFVLL